MSGAPATTPQPAGSRVMQERPWGGLGVGLVPALVVPVALLDDGAGAAVLLGPAAYLLGALLLARAWPWRRLGPANAVTLSRLVGTAWITSLVAGGHADPGTVVVLALVCLALDGVDGRVARATGTGSAAGARFDVEVDAALVLVLSAAVAGSGGAGWWVLSIGLVRYVDLAAELAWPWLAAPVFPSTARKVVGVCQVVALVLALLAPLVPGVPAGLSAAVLASALAALLWSFGRDAIWLHRRSRAQPARTA